MTIKPVVTSGKSSKDDDPEEQAQNVSTTNREKRKAFEENGQRHVRRTPQKSKKHNHHHPKPRLEGPSPRNVVEGNPNPFSGLCPLGVNVVAAATNATLGRSSPKTTMGSVVAAPPAAGSGNDEETPSGYNSGDEHQGRDAGLTEGEWKQRDDEFVKIMAKEGLIVKEIEEDGACLFRAISLQLYGDQDMHEDIRQQTMDYISQNREYFAQFLTEDISCYIARKRKKNVHGNHIEIQAMSELYNRPVELYCYQTKPINIFNAEQRNNGYEPLRLSYQRSSHYNAILDPYKASVGVGLGLAGYQPDELDLKQVQQAMRVSEELQIEQTMFEDKLKTTDWEATNEAIEEQIARESYLQWCRENLQRTKKSVSATVTSQSTLSMPGSSGGSMGSSGSAGPINATSSSVTGGEAGPLISCESPTGPTGTAQYQSDDGLKCSSGSSTCASTASSSASGSSSIMGSGPFDGIRQRRRRRRHNHHSGHSIVERGSDLPRASPPESLGGLNLAETRSTDSNDSDFGDESMSKKVKRRLEGADDEVEEEKGAASGASSGSQGNQESANGTKRHSCSSVELTEPGPSTSGSEQQQPDFYLSLLESSYMDDGSIQMTEEEMIQRAIQMSRIDYITKIQKHSDYDSP